MARLIFGHPSDNLAGTGTITPSTEDAGYLKANLYDGNPAKPFRFTATTGNVVWNFGSAKQIDLVAIIMHNLAAGLEVRIQGNATNAWGAPSLDQTITIPAYDKDGFPVNPWIDLTGIGSRTFQFWRLVVVGVNTANVALGEVWLIGTKRSLVHNISWGLNEGVERPIIEHRTDFEVPLIYDLGVKVKTLNGAIETNDAGLTAIRQWWDACNGRAKGTLIVLDPAVNEALLVRWAETRREDEREFTNVNTIQVAWREISRGLVL